MRRLIIVLLICLLLVIGLLVYLKLTDASYQSGLVFLDVGQGDSALIRLATGQKILVDCGPDRKVLSKLGKYLPFYDRQIDYLIVSHFDLDHYGGCIDVLKRYKVKNIVENGDEKIYDPYWREWKREMQAEKAEVFVVRSPTEWVFGDTRLEFIFPDGSLKVDAAPGDGNNHSIVFRLTTPSTTILFTGDAEEPLEKALVGKYCADKFEVLNSKLETNSNYQNTKNLNFEHSSFGFVSDFGFRISDLKPNVSATTRTNGNVLYCKALRSNILKAGHHGSDSSSGQQFLEAVNPDKAVISVGVNKFGHPSLRVLRRMERLGIETLRTDELGDILL